MVLVADKYCPTATAEHVCTPETNKALQSVIDAINSIQFNHMDFNFPDVFDFLNDFMFTNLKLINILSMDPLIKLLKPVYDWLNKKRCFWIVWEKFCFRIKDIFSNWLITFVNGIINSFLKPLLSPIKKLFASLKLPSLPSLKLGAAFPSFTIDFDAGNFNIPCLDYDDTAESFEEKCFDFPTLKLPSLNLPFPQVKNCNEACDSSCSSSCNTGCDSACNGSCDSSCDGSCDFLGSSCDSKCNSGCDSSCDTSCNTGCDSDCDTGCDSSCIFSNKCATTSGRRLDDSSDAITAGSKAIGWSERFAAAAAKEGK